MPETTSPNGVKPIESSASALSFKIDEDMRRARIWARRFSQTSRCPLIRILGGSSLIGTFHFAVIFGSPFIPNCTTKPLMRPKERVVIVIAFRHQLVKVICPQGRPVAVHLNNHVALRRFKFHFVFGRYRRLGRLFRRGSFGRGRRRPATKAHMPTKIKISLLDHFASLQFNPVPVSTRTAHLTDIPIPSLSLPNLSTRHVRRAALPTPIRREPAKSSRDFIFFSANSAAMRIIAILIRSAAVPCSGVFTAVRSANHRADGFRECISGMAAPAMRRVFATPEARTSVNGFIDKFAHTRRSVQNNA